MATKPGLVPDEAQWIIFLDKDAEPCGWFPSKSEALDWITASRSRGNLDTFTLYGPDSQHSAAISNKIVWEKSNG